MQCKGVFVFKSIEEKDGGEFTNDKGELIRYDSSYQLRVDDKAKNGKIYERKLKIPKDNITLVDKIKKLNEYDKIELLCEIEFYGSVAKVVPIDLVNSNNK